MNTNSIIIGLNRVSVKISGNFNCNTFNVFYAILCNLCAKAIYIGETNNSVRQRMIGHWSDIKHNRNKPVDKHFNKPDHMLENLRLAVIKKVKVITKSTTGRQRKKLF